MADVEMRSVEGKAIGKRPLPEAWFGASVNVPLMHQVVVAGAAARRAGTHATKTRGEVSGGGRKPWRQKGTGRARQGSIRAPQWSGGGVVHGPTPRDHSVRVNKKMKAASLRSALTDASASGKLALVEDVMFDAPSTKDALALLGALELEGKVLVVLPEPNAETELSFRNVRSVKIAYPGNLSTYDLLYADRVLFTASALDRLTGESTVASDAAPASATRAKPSEDDGATEGSAEKKKPSGRRSPKAATAESAEASEASDQEEPAEAPEASDEPADDPNAPADAADDDGSEDEGSDA
jgi:large subunit ribosomal protein L4